MKTRGWTLVILCALALAGAIIAGCGGRTVDMSGESDGGWSYDGNPPIESPTGQSDFVSASGGGHGGGGGSADAGSSASDGGGGSSADTGRIIEEGDIWKVSGDWLFVLNQYRGLQIISLADTAAPRLAATVAILGRPIEMYLRDGNAYVVVSDYFNTWREGTESFLHEFRGSQLRVVDVRDPEHPLVAGGLDLAGQVTDTRIVGDILYTVSNRYSYYYYGSTDDQNLTSVYAISITDPGDVRIVDQLDFPKIEGYENHIHASTDAIFIASGQNNYGSGSSKTMVTYVDIHDPAGKIRKGTTFTLPGYVADRWQMDYTGRIFRAVTPEYQWGNGYPSLYTYRVESPDTITQLAKLTLTLPRPESLTAVRFDGARAYVVTYERKDPLFTIDLSDPATPLMGGELQMPGWLDYIEPRGDLLVALGHDDASGETLLAVSLFDVSDLSIPKMVQRVTFGEGWGWVAGEKDDIRKVFKVLDDLGLILVPFSGYSSKDYSLHSGVQLIDYRPVNRTDAPLVRRGLVEHAGWVDRAMPFKSKLLTLSDETFQVVDISDRDRPVLNAALELTRNSVAFAVAGGYGIELSTGAQYDPYAYYGKGQIPDPEMRLTTVPLTDPNTAAPPASLTIKGSYGRAYTNGSAVYLVGSRYDSVKGNSYIRIASFDYSNPLAPAALDTLDLPLYAPYYYGGYYYYDDYSLPMVEVRPGVFAFFDPDAPDISGNSSKLDFRYAVYVVDGTDPANLRIAATADLHFSDKRYAMPPKTDGRIVYISFAEPVGTDGRSQRWWLQRLDLADIANPVFLPAVNIPGEYLGSSTDGRYLYTLDTQWEEAPASCGSGGGTGTVDAGLVVERLTQECYSWETYQTVNTLALVGDRAYLRDSVLITRQTIGDDWYSVGNVVAAGEYMYYTATHGGLKEVTVNGSPEKRYFSETALYTLDLRIAREIRPSDTTTLPTPYGSLRTAAGAHLFVDGYSMADYGLYVYGLATPDTPAFEGFYRTTGYSTRAAAYADSLYLPAGYHGVYVLR